MPFRKAYGRKRYSRSVMALRSRKRRRTMAARRIQRAFRRRPLRRPRLSRSALVRWAPSDARACKVYGKDVPGLQELQIQTLYVNQVLYPSSVQTVDGAAFGSLSTAAKPGTRQSSRIFVKGIKPYWDFTNMSRYTLTLHFCILQHKNNEEVTKSGFSTEFFRSNEGGDNRTDDFDDTTLDYKREYQFQKVNPDRFHIITHKRITLGSRFNDAVQEGELVPPDTGSWLTSSTTVSERGLKESQWHWRFNTYLPIKRWVNFDTQTSVAEHPIVMAYWITPITETDFTSIGSQNIVNVEARNELFYIE